MKFCFFCKKAISGRDPDLAGYTQNGDLVCADCGQKNTMVTLGNNLTIDILDYDDFVAKKRSKVCEYIGECQHLCFGLRFQRSSINLTIHRVRNSQIMEWFFLKGGKVLCLGELLHDYILPFVPEHHLPNFVYFDGLNLPKRSELMTARLLMSTSDCGIIHTSCAYLLKGLPLDVIYLSTGGHEIG